MQASQVPTILITSQCRLRVLVGPKLRACSVYIITYTHLVDTDTAHELAVPFSVSASLLPPGVLSVKVSQEKVAACRGVYDTRSTPYSSEPSVPLQRHRV